MVKCIFKRKESRKSMHRKKEKKKKLYLCSFQKQDVTTDLSIGASVVVDTTPLSFTYQYQPTQDLR